MFHWEFNISGNNTFGELICGGGVRQRVILKTSWKVQREAYAAKIRVLGSRVLFGVHKAK